jgi:hypothetical protein
MIGCEAIFLTEKFVFSEDWVFILKIKFENYFVNLKIGVQY